MQAWEMANLPSQERHVSARRVIIAMVLGLVFMGSLGCSNGTLSRGEALRDGSIKNEGPWVEGVHYTHLESDGAERAGVANEIIEVFDYECPVCYDFEPTLVLWERYTASELHLKVVRVPLTGKQDTYRYSHLFYTLRVLGRDDLHAVIYDTIHREGGVLVSKLGNEETLKLQSEFARKHGISQDRFVELYTSAQIREKVKEAAKLSRGFVVTRTPTIVIGRTYKTDMHYAGGDRYVLLIAQDLALASRSRKAPALARQSK